jgi:serine/threonine-protein kinase
MIDFHRQWPAESIRAMDVAESYSRLGEADEAFAWLERAYERRDPLAHLGVDPIWDPLRQDPRFDQLLRRLDLPQAAGP